MLIVRVFDVDGRVQAVLDVLDAEGCLVDALVAWGDEPRKLHARSRREQPGAPELSLRPVAGPDGAGLVLGGRY